MIITCGQCQAKFKVAPEQIKETGSKVRCSNCQYVFTVYRPKRPAETPPPASSSFGSDDYAGTGGSGLDDYYSSGADPARERQSGAEADDFYGGRSGDDYDDDGYPDDDRLADDAASMRERRDRRRQLYSDQEEAADDSDYDDDPLDDVYDDQPEIDDDERGGIPPLRRNRVRTSPREPEPDDYSPYDEDFEETSEDFDPEDIRDTAPSKGDLGLGADPVEPAATETDGKVDPFARLAAGYHADEGGGLKAALTKTRNKSKLAAILAIVAALLAVGIYFLITRPQETALVTGDETTTSGSGDSGSSEPTPSGNPDDPSGTSLIGFTEGQQNYFYRKNKHAGNILILTGKVRNNYSEPRSFIYLRGHLLSSDEKTLADRFAYAGNVLSEEDLTELPMAEIIPRLLIKGGKENININIQPGAEIPFMMVFDNVPDGTEQYRIDAVGSDPAQ